MREIGGAVGIAAVSTVLASRAADATGLSDPEARATATLEGFQSAFTVTLVLATLGALVAAVSFPRSRPDVTAPARALDAVPVPVGAVD